MKKAGISLALVLGLSSCGVGGNFGSDIAVGVGAYDAGSNAAVVKTITPATPTTPAGIDYAVTPGKAAEFRFSARPGSTGGYIRGYRITKDTISYGGQTITHENGGDSTTIDVYFTSGYVCPDRVEGQSCDPFSPDTVPGNGTSSSLSIDLVNGLTNIARNYETNVYRSTNLEFFGVSATGKPFTLKAENVNSTVTFSSVQK